MIAELLTKALPVIKLEQRQTSARFAAVKVLQKALTALGEYYGKIDGKFGTLTDGAVRQFQQKHGVSVDGDVGPVTAALIDAALGKSTVLPKPVEVSSQFPYQKEYTILWETMQIRNSVMAAVDRRIDFLRQPERWAEYEKLAKATGVPPQVTAIINEREASGNLKGVLHNGQLIVGTDRKTTIVPKGLGPFRTFFDAGVDAYRREGLDKFDWRAGGPARTAYALEKFNGFGYRNRGNKSPYLWAGSQHYVKGKFVADGKYDPNYVDAQLGGMVLLKRMMQRDPGLSWG